MQCSANAEEFSTSRRILKEVHNFFPGIKVNFAYSLAKGGVAIHTSSKSDRDLLLEQLPSEAFCGGKRHPPKARSSTAVFIKGVDTSVDVNWNKKYVLWNVDLPNSVCLNRLSCTEVGIYNGANSPNGFLITAVA